MCERLVEQQRERIGEQCARDRGALTLASGELTRPAVEVLLDMQRCRRFTNACVVALAPAAQREPKVLAHGHVGEERIVLSDQRDAALLRRFRAARTRRRDARRRFAAAIIPQSHAGASFFQRPTDQ